MWHGNKWTLAQSASNGLQIAVNGTVDPSTANVVLLETLGGKIVQENTAGNWYSEAGPGGAWSQIAAPVAPPSVTTGTGSDTLVFSVSEDAYQGDAQFTVSVDGKQLGGTFTTTALHAAGVSQSFTFKGDWAVGAHPVVVNFLNDAWGGSSATDRNLYVDGISYNGTAVGQNAELGGSGPQGFSVTDSTVIPPATTGVTLTGTTGNDTLTGGAGNDTLNGGTGADTMIGGAGDDTYFVDNVVDVVTENAGDGTDTILASVGYTLAAGSAVEFLRANAGATGLTLTGNEFANTVVGNTGNDTLNGGAGNDTLNGGAGADIMAGGTGNDAYFVDNAPDVVTENAGEGTDTVFASVSYTLAAGSEVEFLRGNAGATGLTLTGNELANTVVGNTGNDTLNGGAGNDTLNGGAGADTMAGGTGNDTYFVDNALDVVTENAGEGTDTVFASVGYTLAAGSEVEFLRANAGATGLTLTGNEFANTVVGNTGNDTLSGRCRQ